MFLRIREARKRAKLSQEAVAKYCGVSRNAVTQWESANKDSRTMPSTENLIALSEVANSSLRWIATGKEEASLTTNTQGIYSDESLSKNEKKMLEVYRKCTEEQQKMTIHMLEGLLNLGTEAFDSELDGLRTPASK